MRKLTVKNFSVIKDAELEFGKITVLIGPQSSGKSLLCKLAYFFQEIVVEQIEDAMRIGDAWISVEQRAQRKFFEWFLNVGASSEAKEVRYSDGDYVIWVAGGLSNHLGHGSLSLKLSSQIQSSYEAIWEDLVRERSRMGGFSDYRYYVERIREAIRSLCSPNTQKVYSYIPSTRAFFVSPQRAVQGTANRGDEITLRFSQDLNFDFGRRIPIAGRGHELTKWIDEASNHILQGEIVIQGEAFFFQAKDGRELPLSILSSGTQELLPLLTCLREFVSASVTVDNLLGLGQALHQRLIYVEEPEANIFPSSQYDLVRIFARMAKEPTLDASMVITTHSPYILSSFNNLLEAWHTGHMDEQRAEAVRAVIDEKYWINPDKFRAYSIDDGYLESIMDEETHLIKDNFLDSVSERIGGEFDELLRIGYVEA